MSFHMVKQMARAIAQKHDAKKTRTTENGKEDKFKRKTRGGNDTASQSTNISSRNSIFSENLEEFGAKLGIVWNAGNKRGVTSKEGGSK